MKIYRLCSLLIPVVLLTSCGVSKFIPEDEYLYTGAEINIEGPEDRKKEMAALESELSGLLRPSPNTSGLLGRPGLRWHYRVEKGKGNFITRFLNRRFGEEPVYLSDVNIERNREILLNRIENRGYFDARVDYRIDTIQKNKAALNLEIKAGPPWTIKSYQYEAISLPDTVDLVKTRLDSLLAESVTRSEIRPGMNYDLRTFRRERERITDELLELGYFFFIPDYLHFSVDTSAGDRKTDLFLQLKPRTPQQALLPYKISEITVFPDGTMRNGSPGVVPDTVVMENYKVISATHQFLPWRFDNYILFEKGDWYKRTASNQTRQRLFSIGAFGFVNVRHTKAQPLEGEDEEYGKLSTRINLSPTNRRNIRGELQAISKSNNFMGPLLSGEYKDRNTLGGGEQLTLGLRLGYETQVTGGSQTGLSALEAGIFGELSIPRIIAPINWKDNIQYRVPRTQIKVSYSILDRVSNYQLQSANLSFGYNWHANRFVYHSINPVALTFTRLTRTSDDFLEVLERNIFLQRSFEQQFIPGAEYTFTFNQLVDRRRARPYLIQFRTDIAGNLAALTDEIFNEEPKNKIFGREYARYLRFDLDARKYIRMGEDRRLIARIFGGIGIPLGNSLSLPYIKQYFSGGPNSVRAFRIRSLGPGSYAPAADDQSAFFDQAGDIRIEANLEYRFPLFSYLKGAVFADAGNVWLYNENASLPGGKFSSSWTDELALGVGFGMRLDIDFFVVRLDLATPLRKPWLEDGERWTSSWRPLKKSWRQDNLIWNLAIGYPF